MDCLHYKVWEDGRRLSRAAHIVLGVTIDGHKEILAVYPQAQIRNWENNREDVSSFFQFSDNILRIMYTTNFIEGRNRQYRKVTKTKSVYPNDTALEKLLYRASRNVAKK